MELPSLIKSHLKISANSVHGQNHWKNVEKIGHYIADRNGADKKVISAFAFTHDTGRENEFEDFGHGKRSEEIIRKNFSSERLGLNVEQYVKLLQAVANHDNEDARSADITVQTCWDADRLDLPRVGITPYRNFLYTEVGKSKEIFAFLNINDIGFYC